VPLILRCDQCGKEFEAGVHVGPDSGGQVCRLSGGNFYLFEYVYAAKPVVDGENEEVLIGYKVACCADCMVGIDPDAKVQRMTRPGGGDQP